MGITRLGIPIKPTRPSLATRGMKPDSAALIVTSLPGGSFVISSTTRALTKAQVRPERGTSSSGENVYMCPSATTTRRVMFSPAFQLDDNSILWHHDLYGADALGLNF